MSNILEELVLLGIVPVVVIDNEKYADALAEALISGGLLCAEITFRTDAARKVLSRLSNKYPQLLLGAGTVLSVDQVKEAIDSGAKFIVSPGLNINVAEYCKKKDIPHTPGVVTPTEIETAMELGLNLLKFFPAEASGGINYLKAVSAPYKNVKFIPTGGIDESNFLSYLKLPQVAACGGSWMVKKELIASGAFDKIKKLTSRSVSDMLGFEVKAVNSNKADYKNAQKVLKKLTSLLHFVKVRKTDINPIRGRTDKLEDNTYGKNGRITLETNFMEKALYFLKQNGINTISDKKKTKDKRIQTVYLDIDIDGYSIGLIQK